VTLKARGTYHPHQHGDADHYQPLTAAEHLEILAAGEMLARYYSHPALIHQAVKAGASWSQIAAATGSDEAQARQRYQEWADSQHRLYADYQGEFGLDGAGHAAAINRAAEPRAGEHDQDWAGPGFTKPGTQPAPEHSGGGHRPRRARDDRPTRPRRSRRQPRAGHGQVSRVRGRGVG
jgi:hypothetical protein